MIFTNVNISGGSYRGALCAKITNGKVLDCTAQGSISGGSAEGATNNFFTGGLVGWSAGKDTIQNCVNRVTVNVTDEYSRSGGMVGYANTNTRVLYCYNEADIASNYRVGGIGGNKFKLNDDDDVDDDDDDDDNDNDDDDDDDDVGIYNHLSAGSYTVTVTDSKGCSATQSVTLTAVPVTETVGITRGGEITTYAPDTTVDASGDLTDFPALTASGDIIAQPRLSNCTAEVNGHKVTVSVNVESIGVLPILEFEVSKDAGFSTTVPMYTHKVAPVTEGEQTFNFMNLPTGTYYVRAKLYNCAGGSITAVPATATVTVVE